MESYVFCLEPEEKIYWAVSSIKKELIKNGVKGQYLEDPPHVTLYLGKFNEGFLDSISSLLNSQISKSPIRLNIYGTTIFGPDPVTRKETPIYLIKPSKELIGLQRELIEVLKDYKTGELIKRYSEVKLEKSFQINLNLYGYPFVGEDWKPHIGLGSFDKRDVNLKNIGWESRIKFGDYKASYFVIYSLNEESEKLTEVKRIPLTK